MHKSTWLWLLKNVQRACDTVGLELYDHLIVTDDGFTSFRERGLL